MKKLGVVLFAALNLLGAFAQCPPKDPITIHNPSIDTIGGITYLRFSYDFTCPFELWKEPSFREGTNVYQVIYLSQNPSTFCPDIFPPPVYTSDATVVLGTFQPGDYLCHIYTLDYFTFGGPFPLGTLPFTVPEPSPTISLFLVGSGRAALRVNGTSNVLYRIQSSATLTNWATVHTSAGGPFTITNQPAAISFYRVQISDGVPVCP